MTVNFSLWNYVMFFFFNIYLLLDYIEAPPTESSHNTTVIATTTAMENIVTKEISALWYNFLNIFFTRVLPYSLLCLHTSHIYQLQSLFLLILST